MFSATGINTLLIEDADGIKDTHEYIILLGGPIVRAQSRAPMDDKSGNRRHTSNAQAGLLTRYAAVPDSFTNLHTLALEIPCFRATCRRDGPSANLAT
jgi:hypothetical protein